MTNPTCATCRFFYVGPTTDDYCRRYPPDPVLTGILNRHTSEPGLSWESCYPMVTQDDWCGEHQPQSASGQNGDVKVASLDLSVRAKNCLDSENIYTIDQVCQLTVTDLLKVRNLGKTTVKEIEHELLKHGRYLKGRAPA